MLVSALNNHRFNNHLKHIHCITYGSFELTYTFKKAYIRSFLLNQKHLAYIRADIINKQYEIIRKSKFATKGKVLFVGVIIISFYKQLKKVILYANVTQCQISLFKSCFKNKTGIKQPIFVNILDILIFSELTYIF